MTIDKRNGNVAFNEAAHAYFNIAEPERKYISVTTLIHKFEPPFDKDFWSAYKAMQQLVDPDYWQQAKRDLLASRKCDGEMLASYGVDKDDFNSVQQGILDGWQRENLASTARGSSIHADLERSFYAQGQGISLRKYGLGGKFECVEGRTDLDLENGVYPEYLVYYESPDGKVNLAGQIDLLVKQGNSFSIIDWKGLPLDTDIPTPSGWKKMGDLRVGDAVFDKEGMPRDVLHKSGVHDNPCMRIVFTNGQEVIADIDHRWWVSLDGGDAVLTTKEIADRVAGNEDVRVVNAKPLILPPADVDATADPAALIRSALRGSVDQRTAVLDKVLGAAARADRERDCYVFGKTGYADLLGELLVTMGMQVLVGDGGELLFDGGNLPCLRRLDDAITGKPCRIVESVEPAETVPTQCIEVDGPTHTYLCTRMMLVTHNTNKQIKRSSYFDQVTKRSERLRYPLGDLDNCNYSVYNMQLSTYAWMIQQLRPEWSVNELRLVHFDHGDKMTVYKMDYLREQVERMISFWKKESVLERHRAERKRIEY